MRALVRTVVRLIWGDDVDPALRPVLGVSLVTSAASSAMWSFVAIWAIEELGAKRELPFAFLVGAILAAASGFLGGYLSDRIGRRRVILLGQGIMVGYPILFLAASDTKWAGLALLALAGMIGSLGGSVSQAMVADLVAPERHEAAYASVRVASNLGVVAGPPIGGLLLVLGSWSALFPCVAVLSGLAWLIAYRFLPHRGAFAPEGPPERGSLAVILADKPFLLFLGSAIFAWLVYVAYEIVLPVSLVDGFGYDASAWGFLVWINPLLVTLFQLRLTRRDGRRRAGAEARRRVARDGAAVRASRVVAERRRGRDRRHRVRDRRDALGPDLAGGRRRPRARPTSAARTWAPSAAHPRSASRCRR